MDNFCEIFQSLNDFFTAILLPSNIINWVIINADSVTIKLPYEVDVLLHRPAWHPIFSLVKTESDCIARSVETSLGR